jgi:hypothetical protein
MIFSKDTELTKFSESHFNEIIHQLTPVEFNNGYFFKRDDYFTLNGISGGKWMKILDNKNNLIGKEATVKYFNLTPNGIPRFPYVININRWEYE